MKFFTLLLSIILSFSLNAQTDTSSEGAGLTIPPGVPTSTPPPIIRSVSSIINTKEPLYIINGYPAEKQDLNELNPASIESINVLKGESALALYGSQGGNNGVIIIETKGLVTLPADHTLTPEEIPANFFSRYETPNFRVGKEVIYLLNGNPIKLRKLKKIATSEFASIKIYQRALKVRLMGYSEQEVVVDAILR